MMENGSVICGQCGAALPEGCSVCPECGAPVSEGFVQNEERPELQGSEQQRTEEVPDSLTVSEPAKESRKERKQREKEEARQEKERAKQAAKESKAAARAAKKAERKYRNIPTVIILVLILIALTAGLGFLGWEYIGSRSVIDSLTAENNLLETQTGELTEKLAQKENRISELQSEIEEKLGLISQGDAKTEEYAETVEKLEKQLETNRTKIEEILKQIAEKEPLGGAVSGKYRSDRSIIVAEDGDSIPLSFSAQYGENNTTVEYSFEKGTRNIDTVSLSGNSITGESSLITLSVKKKAAEEDALAILKFTNDQSDDFFYMIIVIQ